MCPTCIRMLLNEEDGNNLVKLLLEFMDYCTLGSDEISCLSLVVVVHTQN